MSMTMMDTVSADEGIDDRMKLMKTPNDSSVVMAYDSRSPVNTETYYTVGKTRDFYKI